MKWSLRTGGLYTEVLHYSGVDIVKWSLRTGGLYTEVLHYSGVDIVNGHLGQVVSIQRCSTIVELTL